MACIHPVRLRPLRQQIHQSLFDFLELHLHAEFGCAQRGFQHAVVGLEVGVLHDLGNASASRCAREEAANRPRCWG